jgi:hypothetical protein
MYNAFGSFAFRFALYFQGRNRGIFALSLALDCLDNLGFLLVLLELLLHVGNGVGVEGALDLRGLLDDVEVSKEVEETCHRML